MTSPRNRRSPKNRRCNRALNWGHDYRRSPKTNANATKFATVLYVTQLLKAICFPLRAIICCDMSIRNMVKFLLLINIGLITSQFLLFGKLARMEGDLIFMGAQCDQMISRNLVLENLMYNFSITLSSFEEQLVTYTA